MRRELARLEQRTQLILTSAGEGIYGLDNQGKRGWRKLHLGVDGSGVIVA